MTMSDLQRYPRQLCLTKYELHTGFQAKESFRSYFANFFAKTIIVKTEAEAEGEVNCVKKLVKFSALRAHENS